MRLYKYGKAKIYWNKEFTIEFYDVFYVSDLEDGRRSGYVYSVLYEVDKWDEKDFPPFIDVEFKQKILKKFLKKEKQCVKQEIDGK